MDESFRLTHFCVFRIQQTVHMFLTNIDWVASETALAKSVLFLFLKLASSHRAPALSGLQVEDSLSFVRGNETHFCVRTLSAQGRRAVHRHLHPNGNRCVDLVGP